MSIAFLMCVESGDLEEKAKLLCRSIRRYGGRFAMAPVYSFQPRKGNAPAMKTLNVLDELGVRHSTEVLNRDFHDYPVGNKVFACAHAEETLEEDVLVFLDTDTIITGEPLDFDLTSEIDAAVRPADSVLNSTGPSHPNDRYWLKLYEAFGLDSQDYVTTELGRRVRSYFSSGLIVVRREARLFTQWKTDFLKLIDFGHLPPPEMSGEAAAGIRRADEVSLIVTLTRCIERVKLLDGRYNYLIYRRPFLKDGWEQAQLGEILHVHYRFWFNRPGFLRLIRPAFDEASDVVKWLSRFLPLDPVIDRPMPV